MENLGLTKKIKQNIFDILSRNEWRELNSIIIEQIGRDVFKVLEPYYFQINPGIEFPIEFENNLGFWKIYENLKIDFSPRKKVQYIECNITVKKTE